MARPRVFISSTFYDLRQVRSDLETFVKDMGYDVVLNEAGAIAYGSKEKIEEYAYKEVENCDILVAIIGGRFGSASHHEPYSISQQELKTAVERGKQVYVFVEAGVYGEYRTYLRNKEGEAITWSYVDDVRIYQFLEEVEALPQNNPIADFRTAQDITRYLREQWAGLFQRFLSEQVLLKEVRLIENMQETAQTLDRLVTFLSQDRDESVQSILLISHPAFQQIQKLMKIPYRLLFTDLPELEAWLRARNYKPVAEGQWDSPEEREWYNDRTAGKLNVLRVSKEIFDERDKLKIYSPEEWDDDWITFEVQDVDDFPTSPTDDDIPF